MSNKFSALFTVPTETGIAMLEDEAFSHFSPHMISERNGKRLIDICAISIEDATGAMSMIPDIKPIGLWHKSGLQVGHVMDEEGNVTGTARYPFDSDELLDMMPDDEDGNRPTAPRVGHGWGGSWPSRRIEFLKEAKAENARGD